MRHAPRAIPATKYIVARTPTAARDQSMVLAIPLCGMAASYGRECGESRRLTGNYWLILCCLLVDYSFLLMSITRPFIVSTALVVVFRSLSVPRLAFVCVCESDDAYSQRRGRSKRDGRDGGSAILIESTPFRILPPRTRKVHPKWSSGPAASDVEP